MTQLASFKFKLFKLALVAEDSFKIQSSAIAHRPLKVCFIILINEISMHYAIRAMGGMSLRQKKEELESKSSHKSDILPCAASQKMR